MASNAPVPYGAPSFKKIGSIAGAWRGLTALRGRGFVAADGNATVAFKIDRSGNAVSPQVVTSSGNKVLDAEAVALTQRASPVPAPPADIAARSI